MSSSPPLFHLSCLHLDCCSPLRPSSCALRSCFLSQLNDGGAPTCLLFSPYLNQSSWKKKSHSIEAANLSGLIASFRFFVRGIVVVKGDTQNNIRSPSPHWLSNALGLRLQVFKIGNLGHPALFFRD